MNIRHFARTTLCTLAAIAGLAATGAQAGPLRICADPDNLPFSKADGPEKGLYVELAGLVSQKLGASPEFVWWLTYNQRKALRNTILQDGCDAVFALPAAADYRVRGVVKTKPFLDVSYAIVAAPGLRVTGLADLRGKRVAVLHGSPPHMLLAAREGYASTSFREQDEALAALARGEVDAAILWGPSAGYGNLRQHGSRWQVTPVTGEGLGGPVVVGVRKGQDALVARIDQALVELQPQIEELARKYGFPRGKALSLAARSLPPQVRSAKLAEGVAVPSAWVARTNAPAASTPAEGVIPGRTLFNNVCSHCHGTDGASPVTERDLRKLQRRYKDSWKETALTTIKNGRQEAGMPTWGATYSDAQIQEVIVFLATLQK
ncbi:c-type cytochrome [Ramlibacter alkalitolerans]|uniref:Transporter substrate-binding domain-containing protein n=1 Tax=Ramlibacter alkalitolerans TaxID=2039631 RepID=A0ABS1JNP0_9BURK|nr:transporter substrate-binding domain-containing protein [Ramlibacter alkalitolerans]MBL0425751.1 transporter substrate-binding domain-containing protein [Ramlibacter alkalitolerans]